MSLNLKAEMSRLKQRTDEIAAQGAETKRPTKKQKKRTEHSSKPGPLSKHSNPSKLDVKPKLLATKAQRASEGIAAKSRKYKDPLNKRLKDVITCLLNERRDMTKAEICSASPVDAEDEALWEAVMKNQRIEVLADGRLRYRPRHHHIIDKEQLLMHLRRQNKGTPWNEISDTYRDVAVDLEGLASEKKVFVIENPDIEDRVVFWNDPMVEHVKLSDEMLDLWKETQPPEDVRIYEEMMKKSGIQPAPRKPSRKREAMQKIPKERKPRDFKYRKITNVHMPELFQSHQPEQIDG